MGAELAKQLAAIPGGYSLVLAARRLDELRALAATCEAAGAPSLAVACDVASRDDVRRLVDAAVARFGRVDVFVNNAGVGVACPVLQLDEATVDAVLDVNLKGALWGMQAATAHMASRPGGGHVVNISSFLAVVPAASVRSIYSAAKAALNSLSSNARMDLRAAGHADVHVSTVMPGIVHTPFAANAVATPGVVLPPPPPAALRPVGQTVEVAAAAIAAVVEASKAGGVPPAVSFTQGDVQRQAALRYASDVGAWEAGAVEAAAAAAAAAAVAVPGA